MPWGLLPEGENMFSRLLCLLSLHHWIWNVDESHIFFECSRCGKCKKKGWGGCAHGGCTLYM